VAEPVLGAKLSEYHTGYRAFRRKVLETLPLLENSDDFVFDNEMLAQCVYFGFRIGEVSCPTKYFRGGVVDQLPPQRPLRTWCAGHHREVLSAAQGLGRFRIFDKEGKRVSLAGQSANR
jgi:hypothetical protein